MKKNTAKLIGWTIFIVYIAVTLYLLFFAEGMGRSHLKASYTYNLQLFKEITRFIEWAKVSEAGFNAMMINVVGNVACFVPFGILLPINIKKCDRFLSVLLMTFVFSVIVESVQLITRTGSFDVDDIFLNTLGGVIGYILLKVIGQVRLCLKK